MSRFPTHEIEDAPGASRPLSGWSDFQLAEAFAFLGLTVFTGYFLNYAQTDSDI